MQLLVLAACDAFNAAKTRLPEIGFFCFERCHELRPGLLQGQLVLKRMLQKREAVSDVRLGVASVVEVGLAWSNKSLSTSTTSALQLFVRCGQNSGQLNVIIVA